VSPELLLNDDRFEVLWGKKHFMDKLINIVLDEAHVIKEWGNAFRTDYLKIVSRSYTTCILFCVILCGVFVIFDRGLGTTAKQHQTATASFGSRRRK